jgi:hypothetical protein
VDPGQSTGVAIFRNGDVQVCVVNLWHGVEEMVTSVQPHTLVVESFRLFPGMAKTFINHSIEPSEVIGAIREIAERYHVPVVFQNSSMINTIEIVYRPEWNSEHVRDAIKHGLVYLHRKHLMMKEYAALLVREKGRR